MDFTGASVTRTDGQVNFNWGLNAPIGGIGADTFSVRWTGFVTAPTSGTYTFYTTTDDGVRLWVNNQLLVDKLVPQGSTEWSGTINLTAGLHDIVIAYYQGTGGAEVSASWQPVGGSKQIIPSSVLFAPTITDTAPITTTGTSTINVADAAQAFVGPLSVNGQLNVVGGTVVPSSTTFDGNVSIFTTGGGLITNNAAVSDMNWVLDYFRLSGDHRLLFGGRVNYSGLSSFDAPAATRARMLGVFPQLSDVRIDYAWGGDVDITLNRAPHFGRLAPNVYFLQGFSGHGIALTGIAGKLVAEAIAGTVERFDVFARIPHANFPGGAALRRPALVLAMLYYRIKDLL